MIPRVFSYACFGAILILSQLSSVLAATSDSHTETTHTSSESSDASGTASAEYKQAMQKMNQGMMKGMSPDPTKSWAQMMVEHHQGAIEMSQIVLKKTNDPMIKQMAEKTIQAQTEDISKLKAWLSKH